MYIKREMGAGSNKLVFISMPHFSFPHGWLIKTHRARLAQVQLGRGFPVTVTQDDRKLNLMKRYRVKRFTNHSHNNMISHRKDCLFQGCCGGLKVGTDTDQCRALL